MILLIVVPLGYYTVKGVVTPVSDITACDTNKCKSSSSSVTTL